MSLFSEISRRLGLVANDAGVTATDAESLLAAPDNGRLARDVHAGEVIDHIGDLLVTGRIGPGARLWVRGGALTVSGAIGPNVRAYVEGDCRLGLVGAGVQITTHGSVVADILGPFASVRAGSDVRIHEIAANAQISTGGTVLAGAIDPTVRIRAASLAQTGETTQANATDQT